MEELKPIPATVSRKPFFVGHFTCDGCEPYDFAPLVKTAVLVELEPTFRTFFFKCLFVLFVIHNYSFLQKLQPKYP